MTTERMIEETRLSSGLLLPCALFVCALTTACQAPVPRSVDGAQRHADAGRFLQALQILDGLPPSHRQYTQARTLAQALERRVRTSHEKVLEGLVLRAEWRDDEAITSFRQALEIWPEVVAARALLSATEKRRSLLGAARGTNPAQPGSQAPGSLARGSRAPGSQARGSEPIVELTTKPIGEVTTTEISADTRVGPAPIGETKSPATNPQPATPLPSGPAKAGDAAPDSTASGSTASGSSRPDVRRSTTPPQVSALRRRNLLSQASRHLRRGDMDRALHILEDLWDETPGDAAVRKELVRVLNQRALLAYGQGRLQAAVADWQMVLRLDATHAQTRAFVRAAKTELAARKRR